MPALFVLVHSMLLGPASWAGVADELTAAGCDVVVPSLTGVGDGPAPYWPRVVAGVARSLDDRPPDREVALVLHSNAGLFAPVLAEHLPRPVRCCLFVDGSLPSLGSATPVASEERLETLRDMAVDGRLPPWSQWWDEADVAPLFPDEETRARLTAEETRLPLDYYEQQIPVPPGWDATPCGYLLFGGFYEPVADEARRRGWLVHELPGLHLHQVVDPVGVARHIVAMTDQLLRSS
jgi:pimeloyl-ACP methyl ester carboxylesterase